MGFAQRLISRFRTEHSIREAAAVHVLAVTTNPDFVPDGNLAAVTPSPYSG
jgi:hypothetical protein